MQNKTINVQSELTVEDAIAWNNYYLENSAQWKKNWQLMHFLFMPVMIICFGSGIFYLNLGFSRNILSTVVGGGLAILIGGGGFLYFLYYPKMLKRRIRKSAQLIYGRGPNSFVGLHKYTVSSEGIHDNEDALVKWIAVENIVKTPTHVFILVHEKKAIIIPRKSFPDEAAVNRFMQDANNIFKASQKTV